MCQRSVRNFGRYQTFWQNTTILTGHTHLQRCQELTGAQKLSKCQKFWQESDIWQVTYFDLCQKT